MSSSDYPHISDEMLSAYIDGVSTEDEQNLIESVAASDAEVAWRLSSLRKTVSYLNDLPELAPPRSFALAVDNYSVAAQATEAPQLVPKPGSAAQAEPTSGRAHQGGWWSSLQDLLQGGLFQGGLFQSGGLRLNNAMIASAALVLLLIGGGIFFGDLVRQNRAMLNGVAESSDQPNIVDAAPVEPAPIEAADTTQTMTGAATASENRSESDALGAAPASDESAETSSLASGPIVAPTSTSPTTSTAVSVAVVPTATPFPAATETVPIVPTATPTAQIDLPVAAAAVNPNITPAEPLTKPTALPTPDMPLAQSQESSQSNRSTRVQPLAAQAPPLGPAGPQGPPITDGESADAGVDNAPLKAYDIQQDERDNSAQDLNVTGLEDKAELEDRAEMETSTMVAIPETSRSDEAASSNRRVPNIGATSGITTSTQAAGATEFITTERDLASSVSSQETELMTDISSLRIEVDDETGGLLGQILVRAPDNSFRPAALSGIRLVKIDPAHEAATTTIEYGPVDIEGIFIFTNVEPGKYVLEGENAGMLFKLPSPDDEMQELHVIIDAGEQINLGKIRYETLP